MFLALISGDSCFFVANLNPLGNIKIPPTFKSTFLPFEPICFLLISYLTSIPTSKIELGRTACGASISIAF